MLTYYQVSRPRKIRVRVVKPHDQLPYLASGNVIDTRRLASPKPSFGSLFFASQSEVRLSEYDKWQKLAKKLRKNVI